MIEATKQRDQGVTQHHLPRATNILQTGLILITCLHGNYKKPQTKPVPQFMKCGFNWVPVTSSLSQRNEDSQKVYPTSRSLSSNLLEPKLFTLVAHMFSTLCLWCQTVSHQAGPRQPYT